MHRQLSRWILALALLTPGLAAAAVPATLSFSARIADNGRPVTGSHTLTFTFWDVETGGTVGTNDLWTETQTLDVADGVVTAVLGADTTTPNPLPIAAFNGAGLFFEVKLDGTVFGPRMGLHSVPYAFRAGVAETVVPGSIAPSSLAGAAGTAGQVPVTDGSSSFSWMTPAASVHAHAGSDVTSAVANATDAVNATNAATAANATDVQCTGCVGDTDLATGISAAKISGYVGYANYATNANYASSAVNAGYASSAGNLSCTTCVQDSEIQSMSYSKLITAPRVATGGSSATTTIGTACTNYANGYVTITVPGPGNIVVQATSWVFLNHTAGVADGAFIYVGSTPTDCGQYLGRSVLAVPAALPSTGQWMWTASPRATFTVTAAGTYSYYLNGYMYSGYDPNDVFYYAQMNAMYFP